MDKTLSAADFDRYFFEHYRRALRTLTALTGTTAVAEDLLNEAVARAWERRARIERLDAYVMVTAINLSRGRWRKLGREVLASPPDAADRSDADRPSIDICRAIALLPRRQRQVTILFYICDMKIVDVARYLGISCGGVKNALYGARCSLATQLGPSYMKESTL